MKFEEPYWLLFILLYFLVERVTLKKKPVAYRIPSIATAKLAPRSFALKLRRPVINILKIISITSLSLAAMRPQEVLKIADPQSFSSTVLVVDVSPSMQTEDFITNLGAISRMNGVKAVLSEFILNRANSTEFASKIGLVVFAGRAALQVPLTSDLKLVAKVVEQLQAGIAGDGTAIGDGLGLGLKRIANLSGRSKAVVLLTDGVQTAGDINPLSAALVAKDLGIKVHTIGVGGAAKSIAASSALQFFNSVPAAEFDEQTLKQIAGTTGGVYFNAQSFDGLKKVYQEIDQLERNQTKETFSTKLVEYFYWPLLVGLVSLLVLFALQNTVFIRYP